MESIHPMVDRNRPIRKTQAIENLVDTGNSQYAGTGLNLHGV